MTSIENCFVIMPITDPEGYENGHFKHVYNDIIGPACEKAGYKPIRADDVLETNMIHLDVLKKLLDTPMAICDLSTRNPNVLFELGLRQAFDKPVVLIQEKNTQKIFDIAPLRFIEYRKERIYHEVLEDQKNISSAIEATKNKIGKSDGINSIVRLLSLTSPATIKEIKTDESNPMLQMIMAEMDAMRQDFSRAINRIGQFNITEQSGTQMTLADKIDYSCDNQIHHLRNNLQIADKMICNAKRPDSLEKASVVCHKVMAMAKKIMDMNDASIYHRNNARILYDEADALFELAQNESKFSPTAKKNARQHK